MSEQHSPKMKYLIYLITYLTAVSPLHPAIGKTNPDAHGLQEGDIVKYHYKDSLTGAEKFVPVIHIPKPNAAGVSHIYYGGFEVKGGAELVLNNSNTETQTEMAGRIRANPNLINGKGANLIINEVMGPDPSNLTGTLEVAGQKASIVIANWNGITCDGCRFLNTTGVTLTTGEPMIDKNGALAAIGVRQGHITIGKDGLDAQSADYVDIISRATTINGVIKAKDLLLVQGANLFDFEHGNFPVKGSGTVPKLAIDTRAMGGMYANKISLVGTESGVGVNLANLTTHQDGIRLTVDGKITLGNANAKTDINVSSKDIEIAKDSQVKAGKDITLAANTLNNAGKVISGGDMRLFVDRLDNQGGEVNLIQANRNLWLQKDWVGNPASWVRNNKGTLQTQYGDIVMRTKEFSNIEGGLLASGANAYINASNLTNKNTSQLSARNNLILTGNNFFTGNHYDWTVYKQLTSLQGHNIVADFKNRFDLLSGMTSIIGGNILLHAGEMTGPGHLKVKAENELSVVADRNIDISQGTMHADNNLALVAGDNIQIDAATLTGKKDIELVARTGNIMVKNGITAADNNLQMLAGNNIQIVGLPSNQANNITLNAGNAIDAQSVKWEAKSDLTLTAGRYLNAKDVVLKGDNVEYVVREGNITIGSGYEPSISATKNLRMSAGKDLSFYTATLPNASYNLTLSAGHNLDVTPPLPDWNVGPLKTTGSISLFAGNDIKLLRREIDAGQQVTLSAGRDIDMHAHHAQDVPLSEASARILAGSARITAGDHLQLSAGRDIIGRFATLTSTRGGISVNAGQDVVFLAQKYSPDHASDYKSYAAGISTLNAAQNLTLSATGNLLTYGSSLTAGRDMTLSTGGNIRLESVQEHIEDGNRERFTQRVSQLKSGGALTMHAQGSILFQATALMAKGAMDIAAKGGFLYAQAMEESYKWEDKERKCGGVLIFRSCKEATRIKHNSTSKPAEFIAGGDITLMAKDDVTLEASRIDTNKNAKITSQTGKVNFRAMPNTAFERTVSVSEGFFVTHRDKGSSEEVWSIPSVRVGGTLTVDAGQGVSADVKAKEGQLFEDALVRLGNTPGTEWLKDLSNRNDVQWSMVKDAYSSWDKKNQSLNPVVGAVIAIAVAAVTAGSGMAAWAGEAAVGATGATGAAASAVYGATYSGMIGLTSQAAVALVENQGNLSKTLEALAKRDSVKSLVTKMAMGGALAGLDHSMEWGNIAEETGVVDPAKAQLPLVNNDWIKVAQRVAAHSVVSSTLGTAMNGGSFTDNLKTAFLNNIGDQIQAQGAKLVGDNGEILGHAGKTLSHAVVSGISAEIADGDVKGAVVGALAAEFAAITMENRLFEPAYKNESIRQLYKIQEALRGNEAKAQLAKFIGALSGALISHTPEGAYQAASTAELVYRNNWTEHMWSWLALENQKDMLAATKGDNAAAERVAARRDAAIAVTITAAGGYTTAIGGHILVAGSARLLTAGRVALQSCKANPLLCLNQASIAALDAAAPEAAIGTGVLTSSSILVLGKSKESTRALAKALNESGETFSKTGKLEGKSVSQIVQAEIKNDALSKPTLDALESIKRAHKENVFKIFDRNNTESELTVFGQKFKQVYGDGGSNASGTVKVFETQKLTEQNIRAYAESLTGGVPLTQVPNKAGVYFAKLADGSTINLRAVSASADKTKARWTVEIIRDKQFQVSNDAKRNVEIKFR
ncbi:DUF637 domain-containing protein [Xenorhabdus ehlersii]|uniref:Filamentous hemagglutinin n=1 Tax=Xenorhabdus ehlersii TaxID=290111 RepID=A0A2D0IXY7_9GAMM|nr:DUF637 domain-containing protein [Xenorhabdus ehlersii]PHM26635.1 hemagglutinin-related protein [Xenorhabdus ehlersii]RKE93161.1 filamentous hemagglutinin [Xenorhabdus ehlersii]